jgi:magnesium-transporting ATPase (P-type)
MIETVFEYLQTVNFIFEDKVRDIWNSSRFFGVVISVVTFFDVSSKFGSILTVEFFFVQFYLLVALILFIVCDIVYVSVSFKRKKFTAIWPLKVLRNFVRLAVTIFFQPVVETLLTMVV